MQGWVPPRKDPVITAIASTPTLEGFSRGMASDVEREYLLATTISLDLGVTQYMLFSSGTEKGTILQRYVILKGQLTYSSSASPRGYTL